MTRAQPRDLRACGTFGRTLLHSLCLLGLLSASACSPTRPKSTEANLSSRTLLVGRAAEELDPRFVADPTGLRISRLIFASLVTIDPETLEIVPDLAEAIEVESARSYRVRLRAGLRFSDGSPLTVRDVVRTFEGVASEALGSRYRGTFERVEKYEELSDLDLRILLREPHAPFLTDLEFPIVRAADAERRLDVRKPESMIGAGPYRLVSKSVSALILEKNPRWHFAPPASATRTGPSAPTQLRFSLIRDDNVRAMRMQSGSADLVVNGIPPMLLPLFENNARFEVDSRPGLGTTYVGFNLAREPLSNIELRRAIAEAIDREVLVTSKYGKRADVSETWIPREHWARAALDAVRFDPEAARARLKRSGLADSLRGTTLILRTTPDRGRVSIARAIAAMLGDVGIRVRVMPSETALLIAELQRGAFDMVLMEFPELIEPHVLSWFFHSSRIPNSDDGGANRWSYRSAEVDAALDLGARDATRSTRIAAYTFVQRAIARDLPVFTLWQPHQVAVRTRGMKYTLARDGRFGTLAGPPNHDSVTP